jgi:hypothetical protein
MESPLTVDKLFEVIDCLIVGGESAASTNPSRTSSPLTRALQSSEEFVVLADTGDSVFGSLCLSTPREGMYLAPSFYLTMGWAIPAALGVHFGIAHNHTRTLVIEGDGSFQMSGAELSRLIDCGSNAIVIIMNNSGYRTQRSIQDGKWADLTPWNYAAIPYTFENSTAGSPQLSPRNEVNVDWDVSEYSACKSDGRRFDESQSLDKIAEDSDFFGDLGSFGKHPHDQYPAGSRVLSSKVRTVADLVCALRYALDDRSRLHVLEVILDKADQSATMQRLTENMKHVVSSNLHSCPAAGAGASSVTTQHGLAMQQGACRKAAASPSNATLLTPANAAASEQVGVRRRRSGEEDVGF